MTNKSKKRLGKLSKKQKHRTPPPAGDPLRIAWPVSAPKPGERRRFIRYDFELGERELAAIGYATVHWAFLEKALFKRTVLFARRARVNVPADAHSMSFSRRFGALKALITTTVKDDKRRKWWEGAMSAIGKENGIRQKIVHGLWSYNARHPERLFSSPRPSLGRWMTPFSVETLAEFGERVGELSFALINRSRGGRPPKDQGFASYMSRLRLDAQHLSGRAPPGSFAMAKSAGQSLRPIVRLQAHPGPAGRHGANSRVLGAIRLVMVLGTEQYAIRHQGTLSPSWGRSPN